MVDPNSSNSMKRKIEIPVGVILDSLYVPAWEHLTLQKIQELGFARISLVVVKSKIRNKGLKMHDNFIRTNYQIKYPTPNAFNKIHLKSLLDDCPILELPSASTSTIAFTNVETRAINKHPIDLWIQLSDGDYSHSLLINSTFGLWRFQDYDKNFNRITPGFWEVLEDKTSINCLLTAQLANHKEIVYQSNSSVWSIYIKRNANPHFWKIASFIPRQIAALHKLGRAKFFDMNRTKYSKTLIPPPVRSPGLGSLIYPLLRYYMWLLFVKIYYKVYHEKWVLLFAFKDKEDLPLDQYNHLMPPQDKFWADPFVINEKGKFFIFFEDILLEKGAKGTISVIELGPEGNYSQPKTVLRRPYHLSYPFIFQWKGSYYMIPETSENGNIQLYKCSEFPLQWDYQHDLIKNLVAADSTVVEHEDKWWLFANIKEHSGALNWDELHIFYSDDPTSDNWHAHPKNPVVSDTSSARPAGRMFRKDGQLFRPSQNCQRRYGYGIKMNKVINLNTKDYSEIEVSSYQPDWDKNIIGLHTINEVNDLTVIDGLMRIRNF